jgi:hypothetical protein
MKTTCFVRVESIERQARHVFVFEFFVTIPDSSAEVRDRKIKFDWIGFAKLQKRTFLE